MACACARLAGEKRGHRIVVYDVLESFRIADFFVIASGSHPRQIRAIADHIDHELGKAGVKRLGSEGYDTARWVLLDYGDVVVHVFSEDARRFYDLELLWGDAKRVAWEEHGAAPLNASG